MYFSAWWGFEPALKPIRILKLKCAILTSLYKRLTPQPIKYPPSTWLGCHVIHLYFAYFLLECNIWYMQGKGSVSFLIEYAIKPQMLLMLNQHSVL